MVLEVETDTGKVDERLDAGLAELLWVTCGVSAKDQHVVRVYLPMPDR